MIILLNTRDVTRGVSADIVNCNSDGTRDVTAEVGASHVTIGDTIKAPRGDFTTDSLARYGSASGYDVIYGVTTHTTGSLQR